MADPGFPRVGAAKGGREKLLFGQFFPENYTKKKEIGSGGASLAPHPLDPPTLLVPISDFAENAKCVIHNAH